MGVYLSKNRVNPDKKLFTSVVRPNEKKVLVFKFANISGIAYKLYNSIKYHYIYIENATLDQASKLEYPYSSLKERCEKITISEFVRVTIVICDIEKKDSKVDRFKRYIKKEKNTLEKRIEFKIPKYETVNLMDYDSFSSSYQHAINARETSKNELDKSVSIKNPVADNKLSMDTMSNYSLFNENVHLDIPKKTNLEEVLKDIIVNNHVIKAKDASGHVEDTSNNTENSVVNQVEEVLKDIIVNNWVKDASGQVENTSNNTVDSVVNQTEDISSNVFSHVNQIEKRVDNLLFNNGYANELSDDSLAVSKEYNQLVTVNSKYIDIVVDPIRILMEKYDDINIDLAINISGTDSNKIKKAIQFLEYRIEALKNIESI